MGLNAPARTLSGYGQVENVLLPRVLPWAAIREHLRCNSASWPPAPASCLPPSVPLLDLGPEGVEILIQAAAEKDLEVFVAA